jgi:hypothetical protein
MILRLSRHLQNRTETQITHLGGRVVMENGYLPATAEKNPAPPARQSTVCGEDLIYISICSGGAIIKISAAERPRFLLGQLIIFGVAILILTLVTLTLWVAN